MESPLDLVAISVIFSILLILAGLLLFLLVYTLINRIILNRRKIAFQESEEFVLPLIYRYMDKELNRNQFDDSLRSVYDTVIAFRNIVMMIDNFKGKQKIRLRSLLGLRRFDHHYMKKLYSRKTVDIAQACSFYEKRIVAEKKIVNRLLELQLYEYPVISYAATLALINMKDHAVRDQAIELFLHQGNNSTMAIHDVVFKYCSKHDDRSAAESHLISQVTDPKTPPKSSSAVIKMFPELGFHTYSGRLFDYFVSDLPHDKNGLLKASLLNVLNRLNEPGIEQEIIDRNLHRSSEVQIRLETARWIHEHYNSDLDPELMELMQDEDLEVRIIAQSAILKSSDAEIAAEYLPKKFLPEWREIQKSGGAYVSDF